MKLELDSSEIIFNGRDFISFFERINHACTHFGLDYFVVGAFARDIILKNIFNQSTGIATKDIDIAIRINSWDKYQEFIDYLKYKHGFKNGKNPHEFVSPEHVFTDLIPYGEIEDNRTVSFPPNFNSVINMLGFEETRESTIEITLDKKVDLKIVSSEGIVILKFIAWKDREPDRVSEKHARDIRLLINAYFDAKVSEFAVEFADLFDAEDFDDVVCGARALGRRMKQISQDSTILTETLNELFSYLLKEEDNSLFITQLTNASNRKYSFWLRVMKSLSNGFQDQV